MILPPTGHVDQPTFEVLMGLISVRSSSTADGAGTGDTIVDDALTGEPRYTYHMVKVLGTAAAGQVRVVASHVGNTLGLDSPFTDSAGNPVIITAGTPYTILSVRLDASGLTALLNSRLAFVGTVSGIVGAPNFQSTDLAGLGNDYFEGYWAYVVWDSGGGGAAPQGQQLVCTGYVSASGDFTVAAFAPAIAVGDKVLLLHPSIARMLGSLNPAGVVTASVYSHPNGAGKSDALIFAAAKQNIDIRFDMFLLAQVTTVREEEQVDGGTYRVLSAKAFPTDFDTGCKAVYISFKQASALYKITFQSAAPEGGPVNVPYRYITEVIN